MSIEFCRDPSRAFSFATRTAALVAVIGLGLALADAAGADPCVVTNNGSGTVTLPPAGCDYLSPTEVHVIIDGLPAGTTIQLAPIHRDFICGGAGTPPPNCSLPIPPGTCEAPGGSQGGNADCFDSNSHFQLTGTGTLSGFSRTVDIPLNTEVHTGPRTPGTSVQSFDTQMMRLEGQITGDPDFDLLRITAGQSHGLPSPGHTTLTQLPGNEYNVDSFFDITYRIDFVGASGGPLSGMSGSTTATIRMASGEPPPNPCVVADNGSGTVTLPPAGCDYLSPDEVHMILDGLPPGTTIELDPIHRDFICQKGSPSCTLPIPPGQCEGPGGVLGGNGDCFGSSGQFQLTGTGDLEGYSRAITLPLNAEIHTGPRTPGASTQSFDTQMMGLQGQITGDPDFDLLRVTAGQSFGLPSPGHTTLTRQGPPGSPYNVDSFFDITYRIDFIGRPGGPLGGHSGSTTGTIRMATGLPEPGALASLAAGVMALLGLQRWRQRRGIA